MSLGTTFVLHVEEGLHIQIATPPGSFEQKIRSNNLPSHFQDGEKTGASEDIY